MHRHDPVAKLSRIRLLGAIDKSLAWFKSKLGKEPCSTGKFVRKLIPLVRTNNTNEDTSEDSVLARDQQRENFRREQEEIRIATLPVNEQAAAQMAEESRQNLYNAQIQGSIHRTRKDID
jgi:hypothetical protein